MAEEEKGFVIKDRRTFDDKGDVKDQERKEEPRKEEPRKKAPAEETEGMPLPDVQVNIRETGAQKKSIMEAYSTEQNSIRRMWPYYNYYPASLYFSLFDREFFKTIKLK